MIVSFLFSTKRISTAIQLLFPPTIERDLWKNRHRQSAEDCSVPTTATSTIRITPTAMGVRHRTKGGSPPSTPSSVYSGSLQSSEDDVFDPAALVAKSRRKTGRRTPPRSAPVLIATLFLVTTISSVSFFLTFTTMRRSKAVRSLQGVETASLGRTTRGASHFPRAVFLEGPAYQASRNRTVYNEFMQFFESKQPVPSENSHLENCVPLAEWMTDSYPNCNLFHEISLPRSILVNTTSPGLTDEALKQLGRGWFRTTWRWDRFNEALVLKTLRVEREFLNEYYDLHNRDAVAMERLTASPYVVDVYGYCGQSAINELADFPFENMQYLEKLSRRMRGIYDHESLFLRLGIAAGMAQGLADVHRAGGAGRALMVHYDINPRNIALFRGAQPKINDFNIAEFLRYNPQTNQTCGFPGRMRAPWWRAPEEMDLENKVLLDEKVDVYSLGSTLFHLFTSFSPRGQMVASREEMVREWVRNGKKPVLMPLLKNHTDPIAVTFREALDRCFEVEPSLRASSTEIADILMNAFHREQQAMAEGASQNGAGKAEMDLAAPVEESQDLDENIEVKG